MNSVEKRFLDTLRARRVRCTAPRRAVFATLQAAAGPLSLQQITKSATQADRASIYRTLALFEQLQIINVIPVGWKKQFELASPYKTHHHHIHCESCGKVVSIASPTLEKVIKTVAERKGFHLHRHTLELSGCCHNCKKDTVQ